MNENKNNPVDNPVEWIIDNAPVAYDRALCVMEDRVTAIHTGKKSDAVWLLEHPSLYTAGTSARDEDLIEPDRFPTHRTGRGGQYTYHGPGQRVAYVMLDLKQRRPDVRWYVHALEEWIIRALASFNVVGERREGRVGIWVNRGGGREDKIAAIGVRIRHWITFHGIAINVEPDLTHFSGIVPCGIGDENLGVTSLVDLGLPVVMADLDAALMTAFDDVFLR
ncbi:MAG: lipoyl(octanoyl) transferase LipB [Alphaproteobacteria bacterium]|jgi:lipoyl(octanoyl) transferase